MFLTTTRITVLAGLALIMSPVAIAFADTMPGYSTLNHEIVQVAQEYHPEMRAALRSLKEAKRELEISAHERYAHDFDGKRVAALEKTNEAIALIENALRNDQR